jgi:uncharacterized membrane protein
MSANLTKSAWDTETVSNESINVSEEEAVFAPSKKLAIIWIVFGLIGFIAAMALVIEKIHVLEQPAATLSCDFNVFVSCKSVMASWQSHLFGFPNPLIGVAGFTIPIAVGFATLAGAKLQRWFYQAMTAGFFMAFFFVLWLSTQSIYVINVLCPYCMLAWFGTIPLFWHTLIWAMHEDIIEMPISMTNLIDSAAKRPWLFSLVTELILVALIVIQFWSWWPSTIKQIFG